MAGALPAGAGNRAATASLIAGATGFAMVTIIPAIVFGVFGLRRAGRGGWRRPRSGFARAAAGLMLAAAWIALFAYLAPRVERAKDPGCRAYKGTALTAYNRVIADFNHGARPGAEARDLSRAVAALRQSASRSGSAGASRAIAGLADDLAVIRADIRQRRTVPRSVLKALNRDAAGADSACGTLRV